MKETEYLYDCNPKEFSELLYGQALLFKINMAYKLLDKLREEGKMALHDELKYSFIRARYMDVEKAIRFNANLLEEMK